MQKLLFMFFAVGCVYNIQAEESQVVESTTEQVEANETPVMKKNKQSIRRFSRICPDSLDCKTVLQFAEMNKRQKDYQMEIQQEIAKQNAIFRIFG